MTDHFHNFAPADAVQLLADGSNAQEVADLMNSGCYHMGWVVNRGFQNSLKEPLVSNWEYSSREDVRHGQWAVKQNGTSWVQDDEPARVVDWEWGARASGDPEVTPFESEDDARDPGKKWLMGHTHTVYRRPIVRTPDGSLWTGSWSPVEGGAE